jgi:hypothetical protein
LDCGACGTVRGTAQESTEKHRRQACVRVHGHTYILRCRSTTTSHEGRQCRGGKATGSVADGRPPARAPVRHLSPTSPRPTRPLAESPPRRAGGMAACANPRANRWVPPCVRLKLPSACLGPRKLSAYIPPMVFFVGSLRTTSTVKVINLCSCP